MPRHRNPQKAHRKARAPYNFVPLPDQVLSLPTDSAHKFLVDQTRYHPGRYTGWVDVTVTTRSPLFIRAGLTPVEYELLEQQESDPNDRTPSLERLRNRPQFFHTGDPERPVIPGSSLRGMIRSLVEILVQGKLAFVSERPLVYRAVADPGAHGDAYRNMMMNEVRQREYVPRMLAGYLRQQGGRWYIQPAQTRNGTTFARISHRLIDSGIEAALTSGSWHGCRQACEVWITTDAYDFKPVRGGFLKIKRVHVKEVSLNKPGAAGFDRGVLVRSGKMNKKVSEAVVYAPDPSCPDATTWIEIPDGTDLKDPRDLIAAYRDQVSDALVQHFGDRNGALRDHRPIFYLMNGSRLLFFGHTPMFRVPYDHSPRDLLEPGHGDDHLDVAEALFGTIRGQTGGHAGRVFFSDGVYLGTESPWLSPSPVVIPKILSGPKPTTFQHYLTQDEPDKDKGKGLRTYNASARDATLRGHKRYWHQGPVGPEVFAEDPERVDPKKDKQHTRIKPVKIGACFAFRVRFENLSLEEMGALWWALVLPDPDGDVCHSLGMGKPLGLGAVKLEPHFQLVDVRARYSALFGAREDLAFDSGVLSPEAAQSKLAEARKVFEKFALQANTSNSVTKFIDMPRIQMLLRMMRWPGADRTWTRYMSIEHVDEGGRPTNEYRDRPVLPDPSQVHLVDESDSSKPPVSAAAVAGPQGTYDEGVLDHVHASGSYGFIQPVAGGARVFVHRNQLVGMAELVPGLRVRFRTRSKPDGRVEAWDVRPA